MADGVLCTAMACRVLLLQSPQQAQYWPKLTRHRACRFATFVTPSAGPTVHFYKLHHELGSTDMHRKSLTAAGHTSLQYTSARSACTCLILDVGMYMILSTKHHRGEIMGTRTSRSRARLVHVLIGAMRKGTTSLLKQLQPLR